MLTNIPNRLTLFRMGLIPVFVLVFYLPFNWMNVLAASLYGLAALTDWLDGYLARRLGQTSPFGAFLDPVADKLMVTVALVLLVERDPSPWLAIPSCIIVGREIAISALREWMAAIGEHSKVRVMALGKLKTTAQMLAIVLMLYAAPPQHSLTYDIGFALLYLSALLTLWSMVLYLRAARSALLVPREQRDSVAPSLDTSEPSTKIQTPSVRE
nr:CDP-diacylglycerol--glycerol-3-phosphate 3-phosphatidyltransferase [Gammaproteobacteria bacterium]